MKRNKIPFGVSLGRIISSEDEDSGRRRKGGMGESRAISPGSQSKDLRTYFLEFRIRPGSSIGRRGIYVRRAPGSFLLFPSLFRLPFSLSVTFSLSPSCSLDFFYLFAAFSPRSKHADASSLVRGVSSETKGGNQRLQRERSGVRKGGPDRARRERWLIQYSLIR